MGTLAAIEKSFEGLRSSSSLDRSLALWQSREPCLRNVATVEELIAFCRNPRPEVAAGKNEVLAALCRIATSATPDGRRDEAAGLLVLWLFAGAMRNLAKQIGASHLTLEELDSEMLAAFWQEASSGCLTSRSFSSRLYRAARSRAYRAVCEARADASRRADLDIEPTTEAGAPTNPCLALERAKRAGVVSDLQAELIGATRIEGRPLTQVAEELGTSRQAATMQRTRAVRRLATWLCQDADLDRQPNPRPSGKFGPGERRANIPITPQSARASASHK